MKRSIVARKAQILIHLKLHFDYYQPKFAQNQQSHLQHIVDVFNRNNSEYIKHLYFFTVHIHGTFGPHSHTCNISFFVNKLKGFFN